MACDANRIERCKEYSDIPFEDASGGQTVCDITSSTVEFRNLSLHISSRRILQSIDLTIESGTRLGVVGRTGAGKSSLLSVLFAMVYPSSGQVTLGGKDVFAYKRDFLRRKVLGLVPQNPLIFRGDFRRNLDPENKYNDVSV